MKTIEIDEGLYQYIASNTQHIGESASSILRRLLALEPETGSERVPLYAADSELPATSQSQVKAAAKTVKAGKATTRARSAVKPATKKAAKSAPAEPKPIPEALPEALLPVARQSHKTAVRRFQSLLGALYHLHPEAFSQVLEIQGRNRLYFALSEEELLESGRSTSPMSVPESPYWVIGNTNTERKREILSKVLQRLGYDQSQQSATCELL